MKKEQLPDFAKPYKTKGFDVRLVRGSYQLFKISSQRVPDKSYPVLNQTYIGTIDPEQGLIPKKITADTAKAFVEYGLSHFILSRYKSRLQSCLPNGSDSMQPIYKGIVKFMYGYTQQRFIDLSYLKNWITPSNEQDEAIESELVATVANKIEALIKEDIPDTDDRDYVIAVLKDIRVDASCEHPTPIYPDELKSLLSDLGLEKGKDKAQPMTAATKPLYMLMQPLHSTIKANRRQVSNLLHIFDGESAFSQQYKHPYELENILCICLLLAMKSELSSFSYAESYIRIKGDYFKKLKLIDKSDILTEETLSRVFMYLDAKELKDLITSHINRLITKIADPDAAEADAAAADSDAATAAANQTHSLNVLNILDDSSSVCMSSVLMDDSEPETHSIESWLKRYKLKDTMVTADHLQLDEATCKLITDKGGLYILKVRETDAALKDQLTLTFEQNQDKCTKTSFNNCTYEILSLDPKSTAVELAGSQAVARVTSHRRKGEQAYGLESQLFISSTDNAQLIMEAIDSRSHVESDQYWIKDAVLQEADSALTEKACTEAISVFDNIVYAIYRTATALLKGASMRDMRIKYKDDPEKLLALLMRCMDKHDLSALLKENMRGRKKTKDA